MNYTIRVTPRSAKSEVVEETNNCLKVKLKSSPIKGAANQELIKLLAKHFKISQSQIEIINGLTSRKKLVRIL